MVLFISSLKIINVALPDSNIFSWISTAVVIPNGIKTLLVNVLNTFPIKVNPAISNDPKSPPKYPPDCPLLRNWVFDNFILADEPFAKALQSLKTWLLVDNNLWEKLCSLLESQIDGIFKVSSVSFFIPDFNLLSCKLVFYWAILYWYQKKRKLQDSYSSLRKV